MGTFNISQTPSSLNLFLYPNSSVATQLNVYGETLNYLSVDESFEVPDNDLTYVYTTNISKVSDIYGLQDHTSQSGTINYITLFSRAKSNLYNQDSSGTYDPVLGVKYTSGTGYDYFKSSEATTPLITTVTNSYSLYSCTWLSNPSTSLDWSWTDVDNLYIGHICSSPSITVNNYLITFRPNANGTTNDLRPVGDTLEYLCVDDVTPDDDTTYVIKDNMLLGSYYSELYNIPNHTTESGVINNITVYYRWKFYRAGGWYGRLCPYLRLGSFDIFSAATYSQEDSRTAYTNYSYTYNSVPSTGAAWTWADIDDLQIGFKVVSPVTDTNPDEGCFCTQVYAIVNYNYDNYNPEIRTTQEFIKVNYTPNSSVCTLHKPESYGFSNSRNIVKLNTWGGERIVYGESRNSKNITLNGIEYDTATSTATTILNCVNGMKENGSDVTLSGFNDPNINTTWVINDFNYYNEEGNPNIYYWILSMEKA